MNLASLGNQSLSHEPLLLGGEGLLASALILIQHHSCNCYKRDQAKGQREDGKVSVS